MCNLVCSSVGAVMALAGISWSSHAAPPPSPGASWSTAAAPASAWQETTSAAAPQRAGRLSDFQGSVWLFDTEQGQWAEGLRNRALTEGDRLSTERGAQAEVRVGSTELRLGAATELEILRMDEGRMSFQLHRGSLAVRVRSREIAAEIEVVTAEARLQPERSGAYRIDREDDTTWATAWRGALQVQTPDQAFDLSAGQRVELALHGRHRSTLVTWSAPAQDRFADWVRADEQRDDRSASLRYVSPEMTGVEDLDRYGRWEPHPEFGMVWSPLVVAVGWAPFKHGRWIWHARWGWTWVDQAPWGFAPFHYGRWVLWGHRWVWTPGPRVARPAFAPALVTFTGPSVGVSVVISPTRPPVAWVPLSPREPHRPWTGHRPHPVEPGHRSPGWHGHHGPHGAQVPNLPNVPNLPHVPHVPHAQERSERPAPVLPAPRPPVGQGAVQPDRRHTPGVVPVRPTPPMVYGEGRPRETVSPSREPSEKPQRPDKADKERGDRGERGERAERGERVERPGKPEAVEGRGRSTTEHRPRDQRERAQML